MKRLLYSCLSVLMLMVATPIKSGAQDSVGWMPDILGDGYQMRRVYHNGNGGDDAVSTIVSKRSMQTDSIGRCGILYIHGFNDYFFQSEMGNRFVGQGYDFYAVDLRRYGRSMVKDRKNFDTCNLADYFPDIDSALVEMERTGIDKVILMGHSTGGLISAYFESRCRPKTVKAMILNSPFLDWNLGWKESLIPVVSFVGRLFPELEISQGKSTAYAESLLKEYHGEWNYRTDWKFMQSPSVTAGWIRAITEAQRSLRDGHADIEIPVLLLYSSRSIHGSEWTPDHNRADCVLDVSDIKRYGSGLGTKVTCVKVENGMHDLVLSSENIRNPLYRYIFQWLSAQGL